MIIRQKRTNSSPNFGEKPLQFQLILGEKTLQFPAKIFFFGVHLISATELRNLHKSAFECQMRLVKAAKASPHAKFYNLSTGYRGGVLAEVLGLEDVLEDTFSSPWPWPRNLQVLENVLSSALGRHYFLIG